jgi:hypothetical protein
MRPTNAMPLDLNIRLAIVTSMDLNIRLAGAMFTA